MTAADYVIEALAAREAELLEANKQLIDLIADLAFENATLRMARDPTLDRLHRQLQAQLERLDTEAPACR